MNDHNLDDLIIDTPRQKSGKAKSVLTIIALLIVVMIAAIVLTKIILKDPNAQPALLEESEMEVVSPELTLQSVTQEEPKKDETALSEIIEEEVEAPASQHITEQKIKPETVVIEENQPVQSAPAAKLESPAAPHPVKKAAPKPKETVKIPESVTPASNKTKSKPQIKPKHKTSPAPAAKPKNTPKPSASQGTYYIQVGSFSKAPAPNSRLITAIRKQGFKHRIFTVNGMKKVMVGPYGSRASADRAIVKVKDLINKSAFVVKK